jgi:hypothetical protein
VAREDRSQLLGEAFATLAAQGLRWVRWFMLCDGRSGLRVDPGGTPRGLDDRFFADADAAVALAAAHSLRLLFVLMDFHWFHPPRWVEGVQLGGRTGIAALPERRAALMETVIAPVLERYGRHPAVWAWDVINEPEWATGPRDGAHVSRSVMRALIEDLVTQVRRRTAHPVTVGLAGARGLDLVRGLDVDFFQLHWYDSLADQVPLDDPVSRLALDRPLLLGEFPTTGSQRTPQAIVDAAHRGGYAGALAWSLLASDIASNAAQSGPTLASLARDWTDASSRRA